jgi:peptide/nickel transport system substrate-binding protein
MKRLRWQLLIVILALAAIAVLLLGQQPVLPESVTIKPTSGGVYTEALIGSLSRLNPLLAMYNSADRDVTRLLFSGLIRFDDRGVPQGDLAESWGIAADDKVYNFSIRPNAVWHDGQPVTSDDVLFTIDLLKDETFPAPADVRAFWSQVEVKSLDEKTLQFRLNEPYAPFLDYLSFGVLPKHLLEDVSPGEMVSAPFNLSPVGSGPYRFDHLIVEDGEIKGVVLSAFKGYYGGAPFIEQVVFRFYPDAQSALAAYQQGTVLGLSQVSREILPAALKEPKLMLYTARMPQLTLIYLNLDNPELPFFQDVSIRRALLMGINRQRLANSLYQGQAIVADGPIFPGTWAYYDGIEHLEYEKDQAIETLKTAGYTIPAEGGSVRANKDKVALSFEMVYPEDETHKALAEAIQQDWARLGVQVFLTPVTYEKLISDYLETRTYQAALVDLNLTRSPDPDPYPFWDQAQITGGQNYGKWNDRQASEFLEQARVTTDLTERTKAYRNFQVRFTNQMPALPLFYPVYSYAIDESIQRVSMGPFFDPSDRFSTITSWYLVAKRPTGEATPTATP